MGNQNSDPNNPFDPNSARNNQPVNGPNDLNFENEEYYPPPPPDY